ncbi:MAG: DUF4124 domain-containing protein [Gammaproteobacteria bacterium]|nr:DUF4124 domain-containing protein [Gammaproteobacteria bacterium]
MSRHLKIPALIAGLLITATSMAGQLYKWVDEDGVTHYGDRVPPEYVKQDREVVNQYGVKLKALPGELSDEQRAEVRRRQAIEEAELKQVRDAQERDQVLLTTYPSVEDIEALRNRRKELLDGQIRVTEIYLQNQREKLAKLQKQAALFQPYNPDPDAPPIQKWLAKELENTLNSILVYEQTLIEKRQKQSELVAKFDADIDRFRELTAVNSSMTD